MVSSMFLFIPCILIINQVDFKDPDNIQVARTVFFASHAALLLMAGWLYKVIKGKRDASPVIIPATSSSWAPPTPAKTLTTEEYDLEQLKQYFTSLLMAVVICSVLHFNMGLVPPLIIQAVMNTNKLFEHQLFKLHVLSHNDPSLSRPWLPPPNPLASFFGGSNEDEKEDDTETETKEVKKIKKKKKKKSGAEGTKQRKIAKTKVATADDTKSDDTLFEVE